MWKFFIILVVILEFSILGYWIYSGAEMLTKTKVPVTTTKKDELFGTEIQETVLVDKFVLGLDYTGPAVLVLGSIGVISIIFYRRELKSKV